jgi:predicted nucleotide-binding protein
MVKMTVTANASVILVKSDSSSHIEVTILPILLEREQLVMRRIKALEEVHRLHDLDNVVDLVKDDTVRSIMAKQLIALREKAALYEREIEIKGHNVFIGSSAEGLRIAEAIQLNFDHDCETTLWSQGVFGLSEGTLEALVRATVGFDFAVLVLTPDDLVTKREREGSQPRDNVLFELGLFMGKVSIPRQSRGL